MSASIDLNLELQLDARWITLEISHKKSDIRDFIFTENFKIKTAKEHGTLNLIFEQLKNSLARRSKLMSNCLAINIPKASGYTDLTKYRDGIELRGYYQSHKYFQTLFKDESSHNWSIKSGTELFSKNKLKLSQLPFIAVHVRGGDYLRKSHIYYSLNTDYYSKALKIMKEELGDLSVVVFSDDVEHAKKF